MTDKKTLPPEDRQLAEQLESLAQRLTPDAKFERELEKQLMQTQSPEPKAKGFFAQALPALGLALGLIVLALVLTRALRSIPPQPAAGNTPVPQETLPMPTPLGKEYDWSGISLFLQTTLPNLPAEANIYQLEPEHFASLETVRALATQFGMTGEIYTLPPEVPGTSNNDFLMVDGNQHLQVRSDFYFSYYPDITRLTNSYNPVEYPNAETLIRDFLTAKGFTSEYRIERADFSGTYMALPLTPEGFPVHYENFSAAALTFQFDKDGLFSVSANLVRYAPVNDQKYRIISAEEALQKLLDPTASAGYVVGQTYAFQSIQSWTRPRRENETLTVWGWMNSYPSAEGGAPLVNLDGYTVTTDVIDIIPGLPNTFVEVTGQFQTVDGVKVFHLESMNDAFNGYEDGIFGKLQREGDQVVIVTDAATFILPDVPADVPIPMENGYATGVMKLSDGVSPNIFEWKTLDNRPQFGGGGGGGGGSAFYKLNLTGTPVPFLTPTPAPGSSSEGFPYTVVAGDTCQSVANAFNVSVEELIAVNNLPADCSTLTLDQVITIPYSTAMPPERFDGQRGIVTITIFEQTDGSQRAEYGFITNNQDFPYLTLEGADLQSLQSNNGRPVDVWGTIGYDPNIGVASLNVERFEIPFPDLQFQILKGIEKSVELEGQTVLLFTDESGKEYVELAPNCYNIIGAESVTGTGREGESILLEALPVPNLTFGGYPAVCVSSSYLAINPKNNQPMELTITADQPSILPEPPSAEAGNMPTLTIEKVELVYYLPSQRYLATPPSGPIYIQPVWRFYGHYSDGAFFEAIVQALDPLFLLPETEDPYSPG